MKASELIRQLQAMIDEHGDLRVVLDGPFTGYPTVVKHNPPHPVLHPEPAISIEYEA